MGYAAPTRYTLGAVCYHLFKDAPDQPGATKCEPSADGSVCPRGFECPGVSTDSACYGATGEQILESLGAQYDMIFAEDLVLRQLAIVLAMGLAIKFLFLVVIHVQSVSRVEPSPPASAEPLAPFRTECPADTAAQSAALAEASIASAERIQLLIRDVSLQLEKEKTVSDAERTFLLRGINAACESGEVSARVL